MGFFTRLIAGLVAASTLGAGLAGTAGAVDTTGTTGDAKGVVKLASDAAATTVPATADTSGLPDHLVNGDFEYPTADIMGKSDREFWYISQNDNSWWANAKPTGKEKRSPLPAGFDKSKFAWHSTQTGNTHYPTLERADDIQVDYKGDGTNHYSEITAAQAGSTLYQDVATTPGVMYRWSLKHASINSANIDRMNVMIGEPGQETAQEATRTTVNGHGDKTGKVGTEIATKVSNSASDQGNPAGQWETYTGTYIATSTVTRFAFHSIEGGGKTQGEAWDGNLLDDVMFTKAYKLSYDKNASDATGKVPSDETAGTVRQTKARTTGTVRLASDDKNGLPDHLVNGDFEYPGANVLSKNRYDEKDANWWGVSRKDKMVYDPSHETQWVSLPSTFDSDRFAWDSTEVAGVQNGSSQWHTNEVELQRDSRTGNMFAELCAYQANTSIRQYIHTTPGTLYKVRLKHASLSRDYLDKIQVLVGPAGNEQPVRMTRIESRNGLDATGESTASTTISTHASNEEDISNGLHSTRNHDGQWATYEGVYVATSDVTSFTFRSVDARGFNFGNLLDDIVFDRAYRLNYDKNAQDASGSVPSKTEANGTETASASATGSVKTIADTNVSSLPDHLINGDFDYKWPQLVTHMTAKYNFANVDPAHGDIEDGGELKNGQASRKWTHIDGFDASQFGWKSTQTDSYVDGRGGIVEIQRAHANDNMYAEVTASQAGTAIYQDINTQHDTATVYSVSLRYARRVAGVDSKERLQVMVGVPGNEAPVTMTRVKTGANPVNKVGDSSTTMNAPNTNGWLGDWDTYKGKVVIPANQSVTRFTFKSFNSDSPTTGNLVDDIDFQMAYPLAYDKNASDATGSVPSKTTENTVDPAKTNGTGSVRTIADKAHPLHYDKNASDATGQVPSNTTQTASSKPTGKVSDLVQRTTTREDGSVTVKTIDTSTDVVSGCQVYYPAGQRITLATLAKDDDCWDSSMLTRPGHTQLGWNQDRNATAAQPEVTMVEGGMTVYAVWVGNPVLTYDTNKPNTWNGQMPSTPASVSVPYDTAAADGSGWQSGDTSKIRGYRFLGWYAGTQDDAGLYDWNTLLTSNVTVYAHWQRLQANVVYDANGGTGSHADTTGWQYSDVTVPSDTSKSFKRDGYYFKYWNTQKDGKGTTYKDSAQVPLQDKNVTLYAIWAPYHTVITETGGIGLPVLVTGGIVLLVMGIGSTVMLTRRMRGER